MEDPQMTTTSSKPLPSGKKNPKSLKPGAVNMKKRPSEDSARSKEATGEKKVVGSGKKYKKEAAGSLKPSISQHNLPSSSKLKVVVPEAFSTHDPPKSEESGGTKPSQAGNEHEKKDTRLRERSDFNGRHAEQRGRSNRNESKKSSSKNEEKKGEDRKHTVGGIIFMCNAKTKPDCFHYQVMAVPAGKKEIVMGIRPGLKLFLYDFDLKLLYGIYEASSPGGMMLEPNAFRGGFPAQVRFRTIKDCQPLPERVFKKAILENYDERTHKFKTELTAKQVKKLSSLFSPDQSTWAPSPPITAGPSEVPYESKPLFLTEKEYRTYGLRPELHGLQPSDKESHQLSKERELILGNPAPSHLDATSSFNGRITSNSERLFLSEQEYRIYGLRAHRDSASLMPPTTQQAIGITSNEDQYRPYSYTSTAVATTTSDPYIFNPRREPESLLVGHVNSYHLPVRASDERLMHTGYSLQQSSQYSLTSQADSVSAPVSSRYSFNGALYR